MRRPLPVVAAALLAGCVDSGNRGWDLNRWDDPAGGAPFVEAYRGVHAGRIVFRCARGGAPELVIEAWRPLASPAEGAAPRRMAYRADGREGSAVGIVEGNRIRFPLAAPGSAPLAADLAKADDLEALLPLSGGAVFPVGFDISDSSHALKWVEAECRDLGAPARVGAA